MAATIYHYCVLSKPEAPHRAGAHDGIDMENVDYKRQPDTAVIATGIANSNGHCCGIFRGGMFGLATNQTAVLTAWDETGYDPSAPERLAKDNDWEISDIEELVPTVRPQGVEICDRPGIYVIRWIRMLSRDIDEYTRLCLETWPRFEAMADSRCFGVFRPLVQSEISKLLMLTWYASLSDWENSRRLYPDDAAKWARRSEMELSHWAEAGRLAVTD